MIEYEVNELCPQTHEIKPETSKPQNWGNVFQSYQKTKFTWNKFKLTIPVEYCGSYEHQFKASITDTSSIAENSYVIFIEQVEEEPNIYKKRKSYLELDLKEYAKPSAKFKILMSNWQGTAENLGELIFRI